MKCIVPSCENTHIKDSNMCNFHSKQFERNIKDRIEYVLIGKHLIKANEV